MFVYSEAPVYEALGNYLGSVSSSVYLGTARGRAYLEGEEITSGTPCFSLFFNGRSIEVSVSGKERLIFVRGRPSLKYHRLGSVLEMFFKTKRGELKLVLKTGPRLARTVGRAVEECMETENELIGVSP